MALAIDPFCVTQPGALLHVTNLIFSLSRSTKPPIQK